MKKLPTLFLLFYLFLLPLNIYAFDPFEEESAAFGPLVEGEHEDEIFFSQGRLLMAGMRVGARTFTHNLARIIDIGPVAGGYFDYFFSRMFAGELAVNFSFHRHHANNTNGDLGLLDATFRGKFFITGERFSRVLDVINPHFVAGAGFYWRFANQTAFGRTVRNVGWGFPFGVGVEFPISDSDIFFGLEFFYELIFFGDENQFAGTDPLDGDALQLVGTLSFHF